jgi:hypothetical protein
MVRNTNMKTAIITFIALLCISTVTVANAGERYTLRDSSGRISGSVVINGPKITVRDKAGRITGTVTKPAGRKR